MAAHSTLLDNKLVDLLKSGDQTAYTQIYDRYQGLLFVYACKITKDEDEAEDIVQEVFFYLWDKRRTIFFKTSLSAYLYSAVRYGKIIGKNLRGEELNKELASLLN